MSNSVVIKGNKYGIIVLLGAETPFEELKIQVSEKFKESSGFFKKASMGIQFEGRKLNGDEILELVDVIEKNSSLKIVCVMDDDPLVEAKFKEAVEQASRAAGTETVSGSIQETPFVDYEVTQKKSVVEPEDTLFEETGDISDGQAEYPDYGETAFGGGIPTENFGQFYRGTLRSGQEIQSEASIVIIGDVNPGATVYCGGSVVILGALKGIVNAGMDGMAGAFVVALEMDPVQIRIGDLIARSSDEKKKNRLRGKKETPEAKIAFVENEDIYIETLRKDTINGIHF